MGITMSDIDRLEDRAREIEEEMDLLTDDDGAVLITQLLRYEALADELEQVTEELTMIGREIN